MTESARKSRPSDNRNRNRGQGTAALREHEATGAPVVTDGQPELLLLLAEHKAGRLPPVDVELGELPRDATLDMRAVAADMKLLLGLRVAVCDDRPLPYATTFAAERLGWGPNPSRASRAIRALCDAGVVRYVESMPARGKRDGTRTYAPPLAVSAWELK